MRTGPSGLGTNLRDTFYANDPEDCNHFQYATNAKDCPFHGLLCEDRKHYLNYARLNSSASDKDSLIIAKELDMWQTLQSVLKRQETMEVTFNENLRLAREQDEQFISRNDHRQKTYKERREKSSYS